MYICDVKQLLKNNYDKNREIRNADSNRRGH
jgi:hypothetical protein